MSPEPLLPSGFESLEAHIGTWVLADSAARSDQRQAASLEQLQVFYDATLPLADAAVQYLRGYKLGALPPEGERLLKLMLSLAEIAPAIEWYRSPQVYDGFEIKRVRLVAQVSDTAPQD